jgi:hypothetical protein
MFWNLFRSRKPSKKPSPASARPLLESLEDRTVPAVVPTVAGGADVSGLLATPVLSTTFTPLMNQLAGEVLVLENAAVANAYLFATTLSNTFQLGMASPLVTAFEQASVLQSEQALFGATQLPPFLTGISGANSSDLGVTGTSVAGLSGTGFGSTSPPSGNEGLVNLASLFGTVPFYFSQAASPVNMPSDFTSDAGNFVFLGNSSPGQTAPVNADSLNYLAQTFSFIPTLPDNVS